MRGTNQYGTEVSLHECPVCGRSFTVCPPRSEGDDVCLHVDCESYDVSRDAELFWGDLPIRRFPL